MAFPPARRTAARLGAVQALYQMDISGSDVGETLAQFSSRAMGEDFENGQCGAILRAGAFELMFMPQVPAKAAISEYVDVADAFFGPDEPRFVNGVLNQLARQARPAEFPA